MSTHVKVQSARNSGASASTAGLQGGHLVTSLRAAASSGSSTAVVVAWSDGKDASCCLLGRLCASTGVIVMWLVMLAGGESLLYGRRDEICGPKSGGVEICCAIPPRCCVDCIPPTNSICSSLAQGRVRGAAVRGGRVKPTTSGV